MASPSIKLVGDKEVNKRLSNLRRYVAKVSNAPAENLIKVSTIDESLERAKDYYKTPSSSPKYPLRWKSDKQRIAVIIRLKEEGNLPYRRTGRLDNAWTANMKRNIITIANTARDSRTGKFIAPFVIAAFQQPFHADTGWTKRSAVIEKDILKPITSTLLKEAKEGIKASGRL